MEQIKFEDRFQTAIETWRFEVNSYWTRTSYFAVFETAALGAQWLLFKDYRFTSFALSLAGIFLTWLWYMNNTRMHEYVDQWWRRAGDLEAQSGVSTGNYLVHDFHVRKTVEHRIPYHWLDRFFIPGAFLAGWLWMSAWGLMRIIFIHYGYSGHFAELVKLGK